jgi:hypothetical protein
MSTEYRAPDPARTVGRTLGGRRTKPSTASYAQGALSWRLFKTSGSECVPRCGLGQERGAGEDRGLAEGKSEGALRDHAAGRGLDLPGDGPGVELGEKKAKTAKRAVNMRLSFAVDFCGWKTGRKDTSKSVANRMFLSAICCFTSIAFMSPSL